MALNYDFLDPKRQKLARGIGEVGKRRFDEFSKKTLQPQLAQQGWSSGAIANTVGEASEKFGGVLQEGAFRLGEGQLKEEQANKFQAVGAQNQLKYGAQQNLSAMNRLNREIQARKKAAELDASRIATLAASAAKRSKKRRPYQIAGAVAGGVGGFYAGGPAGIAPGMQAGQAFSEIIV